MRMFPTRYLKQDPTVVKKQRASLQHISPPMNGLAFQAQSAVVDAKFAAVLTNFYVDDDRISVRTGYKKIATCNPPAAIKHLIPFYGEPESLLAVGGGNA